MRQLSAHDMRFLRRIGTEQLKLSGFIYSLRELVKQYEQMGLVCIESDLVRLTLKGQSELDDHKANEAQAAAVLPFGL